MKYLILDLVEASFIAGCDRYLVEILVAGVKNVSSVEVGVHRSNAPYNAAQTAWGRDEKQTIAISTDIQSEIQVCIHIR